MIRSMTGYGRGESEEKGLKITVEIKSVNHRYNDIIVKLPRKLGAYEDTVKNFIKERISRGRIEVYVNVDEVKSDDYRVTPNFNVLDQYHAAYKAVAERFGLRDDISVNLLVKNSDTLLVEYKELEEETVQTVLTTAVNLALDSLMGMREHEGQKLTEDVIERIEIMKTQLVQVEAQVPRMVEAYKTKFEDRIKMLLAGTVELDETRLVQEVAIYADKTNITEETVRLRCHFDQLAGILKDGGAVGRKLDFLVQEMNREVNTIGSKSPDFDISNCVIEMKSEIEKIREQIQNIE